MKTQVFFIFCHLGEKIAKSTW